MTFHFWKVTNIKSRVYCPTVWNCNQYFWISAENATKIKQSFENRSYIANAKWHGENIFDAGDKSILAWL